MEKIILVAKSANGVIGKDGELPWSLPADVRYYHNKVRGQWALLGRKAFEAEPVLPPVAGFYILTRDHQYRAAQHKVVHDIPAALAQAERDGHQKLFILGGGNVYAQTLPLADKLLITEIHAEFEGDTFFPEPDPAQWALSWRESYPADEDNPYPYSFTEWKRK